MNHGEKKGSIFAFRMMSAVGLPIRNLITPPGKMFDEVIIVPGYQILEYGCGPGIFTPMIAKKTGPAGKVYALDIHPLAVEAVKKRAKKEELANIETILSDCSTYLPEDSLDLVIFFDVFHVLGNQKEVLREILRVLKPGRVMSFSDHHMKESDIIKKVTESGRFSLLEKGKWTYSFVKSK